MADYTGRERVPAAQDVLMDIRSELGGASDGYTGRKGIPSDIDVLMDIRELLRGGASTGSSLTQAQLDSMLKNHTWDEL